MAGNCPLQSGRIAHAEARSRPPTINAVRHALLFVLAMPMAGAVHAAAGSDIMPAQFDKAIDTLVETGAIVKILSNYR